ncbi:uncharacterized protein LOC114867662 isoform X2 [Betta splendens]|uniref:Uncharacterized protein LOC114867662 isoform X2 n=1 Tax=Betta splendens TaxID=158456 RepID=A0A9W2Y8L4_BETSP|nr:uncharacterized protein LOC114867662 isoform X2 [Betta splendens]XP_055370311.1 uncharacterized protein LOC114867662 isoform X2 [Betta splendens]XP_055370312.1 uncharacterized protein LOC114867662 isoform X2 [Betta splendens]XP_055370313.1 uncharacterized protein LOC114867662 isoform X2 [Betta splendens]
MRQTIKMILRILLLISFISCVSGSLVVNVTQTHYQAEQNHSITLEWTFTPKPDVSITSVYIICELDESSLTETSSGKDASDSKCPDSGLMTQDAMTVPSEHQMVGTRTYVDSTSLKHSESNDSNSTWTYWTYIRTDG